VIQNTLEEVKINTEAKAVLKGMGLQEARIIKRLLEAVLDGRENVFFVMEYMDDISEVDFNGEKVHYVTEQDKEYAVDFSLNSVEIKKSLRIFFDNWRSAYEESESIRFLFYTNASIAKENRVGILKDMDRELPGQPLLQLLGEKDYESAFPFVLPILKEYYFEQYKKHKEDINIYENRWNSMTEDKWTQFFDLIEWNFGGKKGEEIWEDNKELVQKLCMEYNLEYSDKILEQIIGKLRIKINEKDFLKRLISVNDVKNLFLTMFVEADGKFRKKIKHRDYQPILISENDHGRRFSYNANLTALRGREAEMKYLHAFCNAPGYLKWTAICGQGGSGKTRLAYDFSKEMENEGWFSHPPCHTSAWFKHNGQEIVNTDANILICMDYVKYSIDEIADFMKLLHETGQFSGYKIRFILIERNIEDFEDLIQEESGIMEYLYLPEKNDEACSQFIHLKGMEKTAIGSIMSDYIHEYKKQLELDKNLTADDVNKMTEVLLRIDPEEKRPLYALFIADAWCAGEPLDKWDRATAHQYVIQKELRRIDRAVKESDLPDGEKSVYAAVIKYAVTLATYAANITAEEVYGIVEKSFEVNRENLIRILKKTDYLINDGQNIISIEPDIIGEYWCLQMLDRFEVKDVKLFFDYIFSNYFFDTLSFSNKLYNDNEKIISDFSWVENIERITFPANLTYVKKNAFKDYAFVKNVILHNHVKKIDAGAFRRCKNLKKIVFPSSLETIESSAFAGCSSLISALPGDKRGKEPSVLTIKDLAFKGCTSLVDIIIPESVDSIGRSAFEGCEQLKEIIIPRKVSVIESYTFAGCSNLRRVDFAYRTQENRIILREKAFWRCENLLEIKGKERISHIGKKAFGYCEHLPEISFSSELRGIEEGAFYNCIGLRKADLSNYKIFELFDQTFYHCNNLETVYLPEQLRRIGQEVFFDCHNLLNIKIPDSVNRIERYAFANCRSLRSLELPDSGTRIMDHAISGCGNLSFSAIKNIPDREEEFCGFVFSTITEREIDFLTSYEEMQNIEVPDSVVRIGERAFFRQKCLGKIRIPINVRSIGDEAFKSCNSLIKVEATPNSISEIGQGAFEGCTSLKYFLGKLKVNSINDYVFKSCVTLKRIVIASSLQNIGQYAFAGCTNLKIIFTGNGILSYSIGINAFLDCQQMHFPVDLSYMRRNRIAPRKFELYGFVFQKISRRELEFVSNYWNQENVMIPETCIRFKGNLFCNNHTIKAIQVPKNIKVLPRGAFANCKSLERVSLPEKLKSLPAYTFLNCQSLKHVVFDGFSDNTIPDEITIGEGAFSGCASLKEIKLPENLKVIEKNVFSGCISLKEIIFPGNLEVIERNAFYGCQSLSEIDLPEGLIRIKQSAFQLCTGLETVSVPDSLMQIDYCAFMECKSLRRIDNFEASKIQILNNDTFKGCTSLESITLPSGLREIGAGVFYYCHSLKYIDLPLILDKIGMAAFEECYKLKEIKIPPRVTRIEKFTFKYCSSLQKVEHYHKIEEIGTSAFYNCSSLQRFQIPKRVTRIDISAFAFCHNYEETEIPDTVSMLSGSLFEECTSLKSVKIPEHIREIPNNCFKDCRSLTDINLPAGLRKIGAGAFRNCSSYAPSDLPGGLVEIQPSAFRFCDGIISISLPESIKSIAVSSFEDCINLQKIEFAAVEQVDNYAFSNCPNLREVPVQNIKKRIGVAAFKDCISLGKICFSDTITVIDSAAFKGCSCLEWSTLPSSIGKICGSAFRGNSALKEVRLPKSVSMIKKSAFRECSNLETVEINSDKIEIERNVFRDCEKLYDSSIPPGSVVRKSAFINCPMKDVIMIQEDIVVIDDEE